MSEDQLSGTKKRGPVEAWGLEGQTDEASQSWDTFTQTTTFHGIRYIFEKTPFRARRVLWVVCVVTAILLFTVQVCSRSLAFFDYKTNVDVEVIYTDNILFPAVTICNQNNFRNPNKIHLAFRISETVSLGLYDFVDTVYSADNVDELDVSPFDLDQIDTETFILASAHQKGDFIERCSWSGRTCNITEDFETKITDLGVCYTFNSGGSARILDVRQPGSAYGLSLVMNLEQYEYMKGPQNDAGVKILLHDQDDAAQMRDRGFAVAPGTHTLVGIERTVVVGLEPPYGVCNQLTPPMAVCTTECRMAEVVASCGCRHPYMPNITNIPSEICSMSSTFICVKTALDNLQLKEADCRCQVPCQRVVYEPSLSYAQLSKFNIEKIALPSVARREQIKKRFLRARETTQRSAKETLEADQEQMNNIQTVSDQVLTNLKSASEFMANSSTLSKLYSVADVLEHGQVALYDNWYISFEVSYDWGEYITSYSLTQAREAWDGLLTFMQVTNQSLESGLAQRLRNCTEDDDWFTGTTTVTTTQVTIPQNTTWTSPSWPSSSFSSSGSLYSSWSQSWSSSSWSASWSPWSGWVIPAHAESCNSLAEELKNFALRQSWTFRSLFEPNWKGSVPATELQQALTTYRKIQSKVFNGTHVDPESFEENQECLDGLQIVDTEKAPNLEQLFILARNLTQATPKEDLFNIIFEMENVIFAFNLQEGTGEVGNVLQTCLWIENRYEDPANELLRSKYYDSQWNSYGAMTPLQNQLELLALSLNKMKTLHEEKIGLIITYCQSYLSGEFTKIDLAKNMTSHVLEKALADFLDEMDSFNSKAREFSAEASTVSLEFRKSFEILYQHSIPAFNDTFLKGSTLWTELLESSESQAMQDLVATYSDDRPAKMDSMLELIFKPCVEYPAETAVLLNYGKSVLYSDVQDLQQSLQDYTADNRMNALFYMENFVQVDIFYKEVSYEKVQQQAAFEFFSLLSEVGGFLGLLLGASVLTVCELVDYLAIVLIRRCRARRAARRVSGSLSKQPPKA